MIDPSFPADPYKEMRRTIWKDILRVHYGLPGLPGTGEITGVTEPEQFVGGFMPLKAAWPLDPHPTLYLVDAVPVAGTYLYGEHWPVIFHALLHLPEDPATIVANLAREFGMIRPSKLLPKKIYEPPPEG